MRQLGLDAYYRSRPGRVDAPVAEALPADPTPYVVVEGERCSVELAVDGLHCAACVWLIETALGRDPNVLTARLNATHRRLQLSWRGPASRAAGIADLVRCLGYRVAPFVPGASARLADEEQRFLLRSMAIAGFAGANVMLLSVSVWAGAWGGPEGMSSTTRELLHIVSAAIALPALLYAARPFVRSALGALALRRANMDVPIVIGVALTAAVSLVEALSSGLHAYFESALMLVFFLLAGRYVERRARGRARSAVAHLLSLAGSVATVETEGGGLRTVTPAQLHAGDVLRVATGERLVADAVLMTGETQIDNAVVTGESAPARLLAGAMIHAGAINLGPPVRARVAAVGDDTLLARVARLLATAEQARGAYVALADRVARWYAPVVHALAAVTATFWYVALDSSGHVAILAAVSVLIVTCPCALALAQPAVATAVVGRLAHRGILVVSPTALERLGAVDTVVFDKTGTLTLGKPVLQAGSGAPTEALRLAASLAANSRHPLARALVAAAPGVSPADGVTEHAGLGLSCGDVHLGSRRFCGVPEDSSGETLELWLTRPGTDAIRFAFDDALRPDAAETVAALRACGLHIQLLSGDRAPVVARVAATIGINDWQAGLTPEDKLARIRTLAGFGRRVLMV
ncbi:MAG TPA: heavy metal translocating P-type ATPase, partial [Vineibacter sp.]|nr:heavy metal translocating P-type ATPase [Vineibacter sp.]